MSQGADLAGLTRRIAGCRACIERPLARLGPLPHQPRPVLQVSAGARVLIAGQAPGTRVHASGRPFTDPSGDRLRHWLGIGEDIFYDPARLAIVPMGFCFPGLDARGGDLPPRPECARLWRAEVLAALPRLELVLAIGQYAQKWHLGAARRANLTDTVRAWRDYRSLAVPVIPLPHPSWRNTGWLKRNPWFEAELVPDLQARVKALVVE